MSSIEIQQLTTPVNIPVINQEISDQPPTRFIDFSWDANKTRIQHFFEGAMATTATIAMGSSLGLIAKHFKIIPEEDPCFFWKDFSGIMKKQLGIRDIYLPRFLWIPRLVEAHQEIEVLIWKIFATVAIISGGIGEELVFRGAIQDLLLKRLLGRVITRVSPENASWIDSKTAKIFRIAITSSLFAGVHLITNTDEIPLGIKHQAVGALFAGFIFGAIKESRLGLIGSIGCHMTHNAMAAGTIYHQCVCKSE